MSGDAIVLRLPDGETVAMVVRQSEGGLSNVGNKAPVDFDGVVAVLSPIGQAIRRQIEGLGVSKASVTFGLSLAVKTGRIVSLVTEGSGEGSLSITLEWGGGAGEHK